MNAARLWVWAAAPTSFTAHEPLHCSHSAEDEKWWVKLHPFFPLFFFTFTQQQTGNPKRQPTSCATCRVKGERITSPPWQVQNLSSTKVKILQQRKFSILWIKILHVHSTKIGSFCIVFDEPLFFILIWYFIWCRGSCELHFIGRLNIHKCETDYKYFLSIFLEV